MKIFASLLISIVCWTTPLQSAIDLEEMAQSFVLETKQIIIPNYPHAFNPSIVRWHDLLILSFRNLEVPLLSSYKTPKSPGISKIGLVIVDEEFNPKGDPQILDFPEEEFGRSEDARLVTVGDALYLIYSDNRYPQFSEGAFRMYVTELGYDGQDFYMLNTECLLEFEWENPERREKNWVPFDYYENLLFAYCITPHRIFLPLFGTESCYTIAMTLGAIDWPWGELRGGTPALCIDHQNYLAFFHSSKNMETVHSEEKSILHYFMGAYTFNRKPPFEINSISAEPIVGKGFYHGKNYPYYWKPVRVVFPCGFIFDDTYIWVTYGRQDHEMWVAKLDKKALLESLIPVQTIFPPFKPS